MVIWAKLQQKAWGQPVVEQPRGAGPAVQWVLWVMLLMNQAARLVCLHVSSYQPRNEDEHLMMWTVGCVVVCQDILVAATWQ